MKAAVAVIVALAGAAHAEPAKTACRTVVAPNRDAGDLMVVGEVHQGRRHAVMMMDRRDHSGVIVRAGECLGRQHVPFEQLLLFAPLPTLLAR